MKCSRVFTAFALLNVLSLALSQPGLAGLQEAKEAGKSVLLFGIGMHIEPFGRTAQGFSSGRGDYHNPTFFQRHVEDILAVTRIVEAHGGRMTIQAQSPFTSAAIKFRNPILAELAKCGHEIALHFHEDAHLGKNSQSLPVEKWCSVMKQEIALITQASGVSKVRYWSGGNLYPSLYEAAACAGLDVNSDWKNPRSQQTPLELVGVHPWRPAGGTDGTDFSRFKQHDPNGAVIFLPEGVYTRTDFASVRRAAGGDEAYFAFLKESLYASLKAAQPGKVNVFHFTIHPGEFRGDPAHPFAVIDKFLTEVVDPLVASGQVQWATFSQMADAYVAWEKARPISTSAPTIPRGYITFAINVHDWTHHRESADTLLRLVDLFEKYKVRGDFYFTAEITRKYVEERPDVIERFKKSNMTISYHVRPPHPLYTGFDSRLRGLDEAALYRTLRDYETYALNLKTGDLDRSQPGGYTYVAQVFGRKPVVAPVPNDDARVKAVAQRVYRDLGAQMTVTYHEEGTKVEQPFEYASGLLVRPSDFSVTRVKMEKGGENFWWNLMSGPSASQYNPTKILQTQLADWDSHNYGRAPFITSLIHENNFPRAGAEGWTSIYYAMDKGKKTTPLSPPFDLNASDPSRLRTPEEQESIWAAYEELLSYAASNLEVVTSEDIVKMARKASATPLANPQPTSVATQREATHDPPSRLLRADPAAHASRVQRDVTYCVVDGIELKMDIYYPKNTTGATPAVVYVHGGGWTEGDKTEGAGLRDVPALLDAGFTVFSVNYRLAPQHKFPAMIQDVKCAIRSLRAHATDYHIDPNKIGVWGGSAGGHLVSLVGVTDKSAGFDVGQYLDQSSRVQAVVDLFGPADLTVSFPGGYDRAKERVFGGFDPALASPITYVSADDPPFLIVHGDADNLVPLSQSRKFYDKLIATGVDAQLVIVKNGPHGLAARGQSPSRNEVTNMIVGFFKRYLK